MPGEKHSEQPAARTHERGMDERRKLRHTVKQSGLTGGWKSVQGEESGLEGFPGLVSDTQDSLEELSVAPYGDALRSVKGFIVDGWLEPLLWAYMPWQFFLMLGFLTGL